MITRVSGPAPQAARAAAIRSAETEAGSKRAMSTWEGTTTRRSAGTW